MSNNEDSPDRQVSYWQLFFDNTFLIFFLAAAIFFIGYTVWGLAEISSVPLSPLVKP